MSPDSSDLHIDSPNRDMTQAAIYRQNRDMTHAPIYSKVVKTVQVCVNRWLINQSIKIYL